MNFTLLTPLQEEFKLFNELFLRVDPALSENTLMPAFMKEKLSWLFTEIKARRLDLRYDFVDDWPEVAQDGGEELLVSTYRGGRPTIIIFLDRLRLFLEVRGQLPKNVTRTQKTSFAAALVHEAVHLENDAKWYSTSGRILEERIAEEFRAYSKVDQLVITPLLEMKEPLHPTHTRVHRILVDCHYQMPCPEFIGFVAKQK